MKKSLMITFVMAISMFFAHAVLGQTLYGEQLRGTGSTNNAKTLCKGITLTSTKTIAKITGDNAGFWIMKSGTVIKRYYKKNDPSAINFQLEPGTYYVYPNLKERQNKATVTLHFR